MASACENAYETWLTSPNQDLIPVIFVGVGKLRMALVIFVGFTTSAIIRKPANSTCLLRIEIYQG